MEQKNISSIHRTGILITLLAAAFMTAMSTTVTGNMIPNFIEYFGVSSTLAQWLTSGATLISGIMIPITAFLIKRTANKKYFLSAMTAFAIGSLGAFLAPTFSMLLISRLVQAIGCGMMLSFAQIILLDIYPKEQHGTVMAGYSMAATLSSIVGPTYAGLIMDAFTWRGVFASLFGIAILLIICGIIFMRNVTAKEKADLNLLYVTLSSLGFASLLIGVSNISSGSILHIKSGGLMLVGIIFLIVFCVLQMKSDKPMLNLRVFKYSSFRIAVLLSLCMYLICMGNAMILPIFTKSICGYSDTAYGLATIVGSVLSAVAGICSGRIFDKMGAKPMFIGGIILFAAFSVMGTFFTENTGIVYIASAFAFQSIAMSMMNSPATTMALSNLAGKERIDGSAIFNTLRQISSSLASTTAVHIYSLIGISNSEMSAIHGVYIYFGIVTLAVIVLVFMYIKSEKNSK